MKGKSSFNKQYHNQNQYIFGKVKDVPNLSSSTNLIMALDGSAPRYQNSNTKKCFACGHSVDKHWCGSLILLP